MGKCQSDADAVRRISAARDGSLKNPTEEYLLTLRSLLRDWLEEVDANIYNITPCTEAPPGPIEDIYLDELGDPPFNESTDIYSDEENE